MPRRPAHEDPHLLGYEPRVHLDEILDRVAEYFRSDRARV